MRKKNWSRIPDGGLIPGRLAEKPQIEDNFDLVTNYSEFRYLHTYNIYLIKKTSKEGLHLFSLSE
jgi:hypothetical protein